MRLLNTLKSFKILLLILLMVGGTTICANTEPTDTKEDNNKEQLQSEQIEQEESGPDISSKDDGAGNSSFNYFFYLIYKIKFADIFKLPNRNTEDNRSSIPTININWLLKKLTNPKI